MSAGVGEVRGPDDRGHGVCCNPLCVGGFVSGEVGNGPSEVVCPDCRDAGRIRKSTSYVTYPPAESHIQDPNRPLDGAPRYLGVVDLNKIERMEVLAGCGDVVVSMGADGGSPVAFVVFPPGGPGHLGYKPIARGPVDFMFRTINEYLGRDVTGGRYVGPVTWRKEFQENIDMLLRHQGGACT